MCPTRALAARAGASVLAALALFPIGAGVNSAAEGALTIDVQSRRARPGEVLVVTVTTPQPVTGVSIAAFSASWPAWRQTDTTWRALVGIDLDQRPGPYTLTATASGTGSPSATYALSVARHAFPRRTLSVAPDYVNPPAEVLARINTETELQIGRAHV